MATPAQFAANRSNSKRSTGPKTPEGKAIVSKNAVQHGLTGRHVVLADEDPNAFELLQSGLTADHRPQSTTEQLLVSRMAEAEWRIRRIVRRESTLLDANPSYEQSELMLLNRYEGMHTRTLFRSLGNLDRYKAQPRCAPYPNEQAAANSMLRDLANDLERALEFSTFAASAAAAGAPPAELVTVLDETKPIPPKSHSSNDLDALPVSFAADSTPADMDLITGAGDDEPCLSFTGDDSSFPALPELETLADAVALEDATAGLDRPTPDPAPEAVAKPEPCLCPHHAQAVADAFTAPQNETKPISDNSNAANDLDNLLAALMANPAPSSAPNVTSTPAASAAPAGATPQHAGTPSGPKSMAFAVDKLRRAAMKVLAQNAGNPNITQGMDRLFEVLNDTPVKADPAPPPTADSAAG